MSDGSDGNDSGKRPDLKVVTDDTPPRVKKKGFAQRLREQYECDTTDLKICEIVFEYPQATYAEIAKLVGLGSKAAVRRRLLKPAVKKRLEDMNASVVDLVRRGQQVGLRRLMKLALSDNEWISLAASRILTQQVLAVNKVTVQQPNGVVYEVQVGDQGQIYRTVKELPANPTNTENKTPTSTDLVVEGELLKE
jgi:hypothetical protein